jgi:glycosyltransferase involved in cell wall biosynthesis
MRIPSSPPVIPAFPKDKARPLWSVMIPVYNCIQYLGETLKSVLIQNISEQDMQIEVIDDASTDGDVEALINKMAGERIKYFRQLANVGSIRNFETCINRSTGTLVHILHGDDRVRDGYYKKIGELLHTYPKAGVAFCRYTYINESGQQIDIQPAESNEDGILKNSLLLIAEKQRMQYVAITVRREVYEKLGGFYALTYAEDWEMWTRIAKYYPVAYTPQILADYRKHKQSISGAKFLNGGYLRDLKTAMKLIQAHLPENQRKKVLKKSKIFYSRYAIVLAAQHWSTWHNEKMVRSNIIEGLKMNTNISNLVKIMKLYLKILFTRNRKSQLL